MALAKVNTIGRLGIHCFPITIEVDVSSGLPGLTIVGLPDTIVQEAKERIRSAIKNSGADYPLSRITINLAPADIKKEGVGFDLPIAVGILAASEQIPPFHSDDYFFGELGLEGEVKPTRGVLSFVLHTEEAERVFVPLANAGEAGLIENVENLVGVKSLKELILALRDETTLAKIAPTQIDDTAAQTENDFADVHGQAEVKRALEIAAAGNHNVLMSGPPGAGKTLLARSFPSILPPLTRAEMLETMQIYSISGLLNAERPMVVRPFRSPHHTASPVSIVGGSNPPKPGEITLSHNGVLFLDEFAEFPRGVIESLRQPLEDKVITVARAGFTADFPANCLLIAAVNPCPCGYLGDPKHHCVCTPQQIVMYEKKLSGPILDRIDIHITVPAVEVDQLMSEDKAESSAAVRQRVIAARERQHQRFAGTKITSNSQLTNKTMTAYCTPDTQANEMLHKAVDNLKLSARAYHKILKLARTIADLDNSDEIKIHHVAEALRYRPSNRDHL